MLFVEALYHNSFYHRPTLSQATEPSEPRALTLHLSMDFGLKRADEELAYIDTVADLPPTTYCTEKDPRPRVHACIVLYCTMQ